MNKRFASVFFIAIAYAHTTLCMEMIKQTPERLSTLPRAETPEECQELEKAHRTFTKYSDSIPH